MPNETNLLTSRRGDDDFFKTSVSNFFCILHFAPVYYHVHDPSTVHGFLFSVL
jgi:hypothetical protein